MTVSHHVSLLGRFAKTPSSSLFSIQTITSQFRSFSLTSQVSASHQDQGRANGAKDGPGKRLGCKKTQGEPVVPGNIIFRQRGTKWFPGENVGIGRDHTIFALAKGFVRYYEDPFKNPKRKYIGIALKAEEQLPTPPGEPRRRRLGMELVPLPVSISVPDTADLGVEVHASIGRETDPGEVKARRAKNGLLLTMGKNYAFTTTNWEIGRAAEKAGITRRVRPFHHGDRWIAWQKRTAHRKAAAEREARMGASKKKPKRDAVKGKAKAMAMSRR